MKIQKLLLPILILSFIFSVSSAQAQSKGEKEQEKKIEELEKKLEEALKIKDLELEKALKESKRIQGAELEKILENQKKIQQKALEQYEKAQEYQDQYYFDADKNYRKAWENQSKLFDKNFSDKRYHIVEPDWDFEFDEMPFKSMPNVYVASRGKTALTISKELDDVTFDTKFKYEVTEGSRGLSFNVGGGMEQGTLLIRLTQPNGNVLQEIEISPLADISWNQDLRWETDEEKKENEGSWIIVVSAKNASGNYSINVRAN